MKRIKKIVGERVSLGLVEIDDIQKIVEWTNDFSTSDGKGFSDYTVSYLSMRDNVESELKKERPTFAILKNDTDELMGFCRILNIEYLHKIASISITIDKKFHKMGYGQESINLLLDYAFNYLNMYNIMLIVYSFNESAIKCYERVGFKKIGSRTKSRYLNGEWYDTIYMEILKDDFKTNYIKNKIDYK